VVGEEANRALRALTGISFEYRADDPQVRSQAIAAWREWQAKSADAGTP
jgi:hypothetical protein